MRYIQNSCRKTSFNSGLSFLAIVFTSRPDYTALLPVGAAIAFENGPTGSDWTELDSRFEHVAPFMVHKDDMVEAVKRIVRSVTTSETLVNPTIGVQMTNFRINHTLSAESLVYSAQNAMGNSENYIRTFASVLEENSDANFVINPFQPLRGDFISEIAAISELMIVKHKVCRDIGTRNHLFRQRTGANSAFVRSRVWHFLIIQSDRVLNVGCLGRHESRPEWIDDPAVYLDPQSYKLWNLQTEMGDFIKHLVSIAPLATAAVDNTLLDICKNSFINGVTNFSEELFEQDLSEVNIGDDEEGSDEDQEGFEEDEDNTESRAMSNVSGRKRFVLLSSFILSQLNQQCRQNGRLHVLKLDPFHPLGTHAVVEYDWSKHGKNYEEPCLIAKSMQNSNCILLRLHDCLIKVTKDCPNMPLTSWTRPVSKQPSIFLFNVVEQP
jgi:hypothetical protein